MSGTGAQLYTALSRERPSEAQMLKGFRLFYGHVPFIHIAHIFANDTILQAFEGALRVHIVDYGILYGQQWPCLLSKLARRPGGPPHVRITGTISYCNMLKSFIPGFPVTSDVKCSSSYYTFVTLLGT
jgi:hypothetical protein